MGCLSPHSRSRVSVWGSLLALWQPGCHLGSSGCAWSLSQQRKENQSCTEALSPGFPQGSLWMRTAQERSHCAVWWLGTAWLVLEVFTHHKATRLYIFYRNKSVRELAQPPPPAAVSTSAFRGASPSLALF